MGVIDKNYLNKINQSVQKQISNQPCGCDCHCRPKFEDDSSSGPVPGCNCQLQPNYFAGDWSGSAPRLVTRAIFLNVINGWNCPFEMEFRWVNVSFANLSGVSVKLGTINGLIPLGVESQWYTVTLQPGQFIYFEFTGIIELFDQKLYIEAQNITCAQNYGVVGSWSLVTI